MERPLPGLLLLRQSTLTELSREARERPRGRLNRNLHAMGDPLHRLLNAIEPGSYVRPHRHLAPPRTETAVAVKGRLGLLVFDDEGALTHRCELAPLRAEAVAEIGPGLWHTFVSLERGTVFFEVKEGPYVAPSGADLAPWAPAEGDPGASALEAAWRALFDEERGA